MSDFSEIGEESWASRFTVLISVISFLLLWESLSQRKESSSFFDTQETRGELFRHLVHGRNLSQPSFFSEQRKHDLTVLVF